jgi:excisionase family DNA binding protein
VSAPSHVTIPLPDGRWLVLEKHEFDSALRRGMEMGLARHAETMTAAASIAADEKLVNSRELSAIVGVGDTTLEGMAGRGEIPSYRAGKALRFRPSEVIAALRQAP